MLVLSVSCDSLASPARGCSPWPALQRGKARAYGSTLASAFRRGKASVIRALPVGDIMDGACPVVGIG